MRKVILLATLCILSTVPIKGQNTDIESLAGLLFNFGNPGARSLGMGGAFIGLADDASAAEANPAGLTVLRKPEVSIEVRNYEEKQFLTTSGTFPDLERTGFSLRNRLIQPTFASFVYPMKEFVIGAYYHEALRNKGAGEVLPVRNPFTGAIQKDVPNFYLPRNAGPVSRTECEAIRQRANDLFACLEYTLIPFVSTIDLKERTVGIVGAYKFGNVSFGVAARYQRFNETASSSDFSPVLDIVSVRVQTTGNVRGFSDNGKNKQDVTFTGGLKWTPSDKIGVGAIYKQGAKFSTATFGADADTQFELVKIADTTFHVPDVYGVGVSLRPLPVLTINADVVRVEYASLIDNFHSFSDDIQELNAPYKVNNATEFHLGGEYFFRTNIPVAVRVGWWHDPPHSLEYRGPLTTPERIAVAMLFPKGSSRRHLSAGAGMSWPWFEIDSALDWSQNFLVASLSMIKRF